MNCKIFSCGISDLKDFNPAELMIEINDWLDEIDDSLELKMIIDSVCQTQNNNELIITIFYHQEEI